MVRESLTQSDASKPESVQVGIVTLVGGGDTYRHVYKLEDFKKLQELPGDWMEAVYSEDAPEAIAEPDSMEELSRLIKQNNWEIAESGGGDFY